MSGGIAIVFAILLYEYRGTDDVSQDSSEEREERIDTTLMRTDDHGWEIRDDVETILNLTGGAILLHTFLHPSETLSVISMLTTAIFFVMMAVVVTTLLWEYHGNHSTSKNSAWNITECKKTKKTISSTNLPSCTGELLRAIGHLIGITNKDNIVPLLADFLRESEDLNIGVDLKPYLERCVYSTWYMLIERKYGVHFTRVVATFALVFLRFHERNHFLLKCALETCRLKKSSAEGVRRLAHRKTLCSDSVSESVLSDEIDKKFFNPEVWKHFLDFKKEASQENKIYKYQPLIKTQEALKYNVTEYPPQFDQDSRFSKKHSTSTSRETSINFLKKHHMVPRSNPLNYSLPQETMRNIHLNLNTLSVVRGDERNMDHQCRNKIESQTNKEANIFQVKKQSEIYHSKELKRKQTDSVGIDSNEINSGLQHYITAKGANRVKNQSTKEANIFQSEITYSSVPLNDQINSFEVEYNENNGALQHCITALERNRVKNYNTKEANMFHIKKQTEVGHSKEHKNKKMDSVSVEYNETNAALQHYITAIGGNRVKNHNTKEANRFHVKKHSELGHSKEPKNKPMDSVGVEYNEMNDALQHYIADTGGSRMKNRSSKETTISHVKKQSEIGHLEILKNKLMNSVGLENNGARPHCVTGTREKRMENRISKEADMFPIKKPSEIGQSAELENKKVAPVGMTELNSMAKHRIMKMFDRGNSMKPKTEKRTNWERQGEVNRTVQQSMPAEFKNRPENRRKLQPISKSSQETCKTEKSKHKQLSTFREEDGEKNWNCLSITNVLDGKKNESMKVKPFQMLMELEERINAMANKNVSIPQELEDEVPTGISDLEERLRWLLDEGGQTDITDLEDRFRKLCSP